MPNLSVDSARLTDPQQEVADSKEARGVPSVLIVAPLGYAASMSFFVELCEALAHCGVRVTIYGPTNPDPPFEFGAAGIEVVNPPAGLGRWRKLAPLRILMALRRRLRGDSTIRHVFGLSQLGLVLAWLALLGRGRRLVYLNDELWYRDDATYRFYRLRKCLENMASRRAWLTVTQDPMRGRMLARINGLDKSRLLYLPNSRGGMAARRRTTLLHDLLGCPPRTRLILWLGAVSEGDGALEIARQAIGWPDDLLFVICFRSKSPTNYKRHLVSLDGMGRNRHVGVGFSPAEIEDVYASAHVGIVSYPKRSINSEYIGSSSGKLNLFLKAGVPCLVSPQLGLRWAVRDAGCEFLTDPADVLSDVRRLEIDYDRRAACAVSSFNTRLTIDPAIRTLLSRLGLGRQEKLGASASVPYSSARAAPVNSPMSDQSPPAVRPPSA